MIPSLNVSFYFFILIILSYKTNCQLVNNSENQTFICVDGFNINLIKVCDGIADCPDSSDEIKKLCHHIVCPVSSYRCNYGACISKSFRCDGFENCVDGSDEFHCELPDTCSNNEYRCFQSLECISISQTCDGNIDCADESDESAELCKDFPCPGHTYQCIYGGCIHQETICDGTKDCIDGSDEDVSMCAAINCKGDDCLQYSCKSDEFSCNSKGQCISLSRTCDGTFQCRDGSDESLELCNTTRCSEGFFQCDYGACISESLKCNWEPNCYDWSDEKESVCGINLPNGACRLPPATPATYYKVFDCDQCRPGQVVPELTRLDFFCDGGQSLEGSSRIYCQNNRWIPYIPSCYSETEDITCPPLNSPAAKKQCEVLWGKRQGWISCDGPIPIGTHATLECPEFYERETGAAHTTCLHDGTWSRVPLRCKPVCGIREASAAILIVKGWEISPDESLPWHVTLFSHEDGKWNFFCGGSLIAEYAVLTAGHCVWKTDPKTIKVVLAGLSSNFSINEQDDEAQIRDILKIEMQNAYQDHEGNYGSDLAILILNKPVYMTAKVLPVCLNWSEDADINKRIDEMGLVAGMGVTENNTFSSKLRVTTEKIISEDECRENQKRDFRKYLTYTAFCAGWKNGTAVCNGDSGGGLVLQRFNSNTWDLYGIVSISPRKLGTNICDPNYYTVFTKISVYNTWIDEILSQLPIVGPPNFNQKPNSDILF